MHKDSSSVIDKVRAATHSGGSGRIGFRNLDVNFIMFRVLCTSYELL